MLAVSVNAIGKNWVKKRSIEEEDFALRIMNNLAQNIKMINAVISNFHKLVGNNVSVYYWLTPEIKLHLTFWNE